MRRGRDVFASLQVSAAIRPLHVLHTRTYTRGARAHTQMPPMLECHCHVIRMYVQLAIGGTSLRPISCAFFQCTLVSWLHGII
mmetsp:Transcript_31560/g.52220  ORF Transcript_31560/g.52220 Transcript_31560/m.52220 type:complete len:83 (-) Transcript_31560:270-518(-)